MLMMNARKSNHFFLRLFLTTIIIYFLPIECLSFETNDTTEVKTLEGVEVVGENQKTSVHGSVYMPTKSEKNAASSGFELLRLMKIPELSVGQGNSVTTSSGEAVTYFINGQPASSEEVSMLLPKDALKVEFIQRSIDPKFMGSRNIVNFIQKVYSYGGYTRLDVNDAFNDKFNDLNGMLYSKFAYKRMVYDFLFYPHYGYNTHTGEDSEERYSLKDGSGSPYQEWRKQTFEKGKQINFQAPVFFRARYIGRNMVIDNQFGYIYSSTPEKSETSLLSFSSL